MSVPINWLVLFFFIILTVISILVYEINSKFKWRIRANELEDEVQNLKFRLSSSPEIKVDFNEAIEEIKEKLTSRQFEIFIHTIEGQSSKEIAEILNLSPITIDSHIKDICKNLDVNKRSQLGGVFFGKLREKIGLESLLKSE